MARDHVRFPSGPCTRAPRVPFTPLIRPGGALITRDDDAGIRRLADSGVLRRCATMHGHRLSGLDASFLYLEEGPAHMHVASTTLFEGPAPEYEELRDHIASRLHLVPRFRQKLRFVPLGQGRPVWVDDPHLNLDYHVRHTSLPPPAEVVRGARAMLRAPRQVTGGLLEGLGAAASFARTGLAAPPSPFNLKIGPYRRFAWVRADLDELKRIKNLAGGTVNDVVLAAVSGALRRYLRDRGHPTDELELRAMVPISVRAAEEHGALGNRVSAMMAPLPVWCEHPIERLRTVTEIMGDLKSSRQAVGANLLTEATGFAPPTIAAQAARLQSRQRFFNLVVTNVPGPQYRLYLLGRELLDVFPMVPLAKNQGVCFGIMSYNGGG